MAVFLKEDQFGADDAVVGFPNLISCMGVVLLTKANQYGVHAVMHCGDDQVIPEFAKFLKREDVGTSVMVGLYGCCNFKERYRTAHASAWREEMRNIARTIGFSGTVRGFDTSIIAPAKGTYVEYRPNQAHDKCRVFYKRDEKMFYLPGIKEMVVLPGVFSATPTGQGGFKPTPSGEGKMAASVTPSTGNHGQLHEVNYFLRMKSFNV